ncbi:hypothetical protein, partial [Klebsiella quasipneumoniae]|uniref:hypothetical protein n=1 Tax=Klebsiella quasipneumoniae TaxID=1463165 RepID=UPI001BD9EC38
GIELGKKREREKERVSGNVKEIEEISVRGSTLVAHSNIKNLNVYQSEGDNTLIFILIHRFVVALSKLELHLL